VSSYYNQKKDGTIYALVLKTTRMIETDEAGKTILYYNRDAAMAAKARKGEGREICVWYRPRPRDQR
jgi:hypothetical protein